MRSGYSLLRKSRTVLHRIYQGPIEGRALFSTRESIILFWMLDFARHEGIGSLLKEAQAGGCAKVNPFAAINGARDIPRILELASAGRLRNPRFLNFFFHKRNVILKDVSSPAIPQPANADSCETADQPGQPVIRVWFSIQNNPGDCITGHRQTKRPKINDCRPFLVCPAFCFCRFFAHGCLRASFRSCRRPRALSEAARWIEVRHKPGLLRNRKRTLCQLPCAARPRQNPFLE